jgi:hypothetical protein
MIYLFESILKVNFESSIGVLYDAGTSIPQEKPKCSLISTEHVAGPMQYHYHSTSSHSLQFTSFSVGCPPPPHHHHHATHYLLPFDSVLKCQAHGVKLKPARGDG